MQWAGHAVPVPVGAFLQAAAQAQAWMVEAVLEHLGQCRQVADLFCGLGAYAVPLAAHGVRVLGVEGEASMAQALAAIHGLPIEAMARDLMRQPLLGPELARFDGLVINPPRAGAEAQAKAIATSGWRGKIIMISCNPESFARDAAILAGAGFGLRTVQPVDQFIGSAHVELVAVLEAQPSPA
jgi:23S rRNA (uracil1939-C5)-methyltransferase